MFKKLLILSAILLGMNAFAARAPLEPALKKEVAEVLNANEELHAAFFEYSNENVQKAAALVAKKIMAIKDKEISKLLKVSHDKLMEMTKSTDEKANKEAFYVVSLGLANIIRKYDVGGKWNVYSCPMVKKSWVQDSAKNDNVRNPYAPEMPGCGSKNTSF
ncbi:MAG: hypothetical protein CME71_03695 [Halobacteriovorax sp.]|nr:hypothetical protein [Halobacteriovorax sp.]